jgi:hypothetical protein
VPPKRSEDSPKTTTLRGVIIRCRQSPKFFQAVLEDVDAALGRAKLRLEPRELTKLRTLTRPARVTPVVETVPLDEVVIFASGKIPTSREWGVTWGAHPPGLPPLPAIAIGKLRALKLSRRPKRFRGLKEPPVAKRRRGAKRPR